MIQHLDTLSGPIDGDRFVQCFDFDPKAFPKKLGSRYQELITLFDLTTDMVWRPQLANEMTGPFSRITISASAFIRRARAAAEAPPATPPTITIFIFQNLSKHRAKIKRFES